MYFASALEFENDYEGAIYICDTTSKIYNIPILNHTDNEFKELKRMTKSVVDTNLSMKIIQCGNCTE